MTENKAQKCCTKICCRIEKMIKKHFKGQILEGMCKEEIAKRVFADFLQPRRQPNAVKVRAAGKCVLGDFR